MAKTKVQAKPDKLSDAKRVEIFFDKIAPHLISRLNSAEARAQQAEESLKFLTDKLVSLLTGDQKDVAKACFMAPEVYALEFIEIWREKIWSSCETTLHVKSLRDPKG